MIVGTIGRASPPAFKEARMKLQLYFAPIACSMVPYINLTEAGADFEVLPVNMGRGQHNSPEYLKLNPKHKVPVLVVDGEPLTENVAINIWIARNFPAARLLPADPKQEIKAISLLAWCASGIHPALTPNNNPKRYCDMPGSEESVKQCAQKLLDENFTVADGLLEGREWFFDHFTAADSYFFWTFIRATRFDLKYLDLNRFTHCMAHLERMKQRPSVRKLLAFEKQTQEAFAKAA
jgi:glutathione S-transferase